MAVKHVLCHAKYAPSGEMVETSKLCSYHFLFLEVETSFETSKRVERDLDPFGLSPINSLKLSLWTSQNDCKYLSSSALERPGMRHLQVFTDLVRLCNGEIAEMGL